VHVPSFETPSIAADGRSSSVIDLLMAGRIVVSDNATEKGVEYLIPWQVVDGGDQDLLNWQRTERITTTPLPNLLVLMVQCKFVGGAVSWTEINSKMDELRASLHGDARVLAAVPLLYSTQSTAREAGKDGIVFDETRLAEYLVPHIGPLRLFFEKPGERVTEVYPWLKVE
jgi:hypothetical protein